MEEAWDWDLERDGRMRAKRVVGWVVPSEPVGVVPDEEEEVGEEVRKPEAEVGLEKGVWETGA